DGVNPLPSQYWATAGVSITDASSNTIAGNDIWCGVYSGIMIQGDTTTAANNAVQGNFIGTDATGESAFFNDSNNPDGPYNGFAGIWLYGDATDNLIGGSSPADRNVISGWDGGEGILIEPIGGGGIPNFDSASGYFYALPTGNTVEGNYIGCDASGSQTLALVTNRTGLVIWGTDNMV